MPSYSDSASLRLAAVSPGVELSHAIPPPHPATPPLPRGSPLPPAPDPATQLVSELFESLKAKADPVPAPLPDFKAGLRKVPSAPGRATAPPPSPPPLDFKSQLKPSRRPAEETDGAGEASQAGRVDFKSQLRRVGRPGGGAAGHAPAPAQQPDLRAGLRAIRQEEEEAAREEQVKKTSIIKEV